MGVGGETEGCCPSLKGDPGDNFGSIYTAASLTLKVKRRLFYLHFHVSSQLEVKVAKLVQHFFGGGGQVDF